jgi:hypothetical protein
MRVNQQTMLADLIRPRVRVFLVRFWQAAQATLPRF